MPSNRRAFLSGVAGLLSAGCLSGPRTATPTETTPSEPRTPTGTIRECDPAAVHRPPVPTDTNIDGREYPRKPETLTAEAVLLYLGDFETAFAWNRVLGVDATVTSLNVNALDGFFPDEAGGGYRASSGMRVTYDVEGGETNEREYVANYYVSPGPVFRVESEVEPADPRSRADRKLVQCGEDPVTK